MYIGMAMEIAVGIYNYIRDIIYPFYTIMYNYKSNTTQKSPTKKVFLRRFHIIHNDGGLK